MDPNYSPSYDPYSSTSAVTLQDLLMIFRRRFWVVVLLIAVSLGVAYYISSHTPRVWRAEAQMILVQRAASMVTVTQGGGGGSGGRLVENVDTQVALIKNLGMAWRTINWLKKESAAGRAPRGIVNGLTPESLKSQINAAPVPDTDLFEISVETSEKRNARILANAVCQAFVLWKKELAKKNSRETLETLTGRAEAARAQMVNAEQKELSFKNRSGLVNVNAQQANILDEYLKRSVQVNDLTQDLAVQRQRLQSLEKALSSESSKIQTGTGVRDDALVLSLQQKVNDLERDYATAKINYTANFPGPEGPTQIGQRLALARKQLKAALSTTVSNSASLENQRTLSETYNQAKIDLISTQAKLAAASQAEAGLKSQLANVPKSSMDYARIARSADVARQLYTSLQTGLNAALLDQDAATGNVELAYPASEPTKPLRPDLKRDLIFGAAVGLLLSVVAVFLLEQADRRVRSPEEMRRLIAGSVVGTIPQLSRAEMRSLSSGGDSPRASEAYSMIWANLSLATRRQLPAARAAANRGQTMLITSSLPGEGKSFTAAQLARNIAKAGQRVILVDADLRRPMQNHNFGKKERLGLANVLCGDLTLDLALLNTNTKDLFLLPAGSADRNPTELISSDGMIDLLETLRGKADVIIIDAPACAVVADALFIAPHIDTIVHVVGAGQVDSELVRDTTAALASAAPKIMTYLMNRTPGGASTAYKYYQSYQPWHENKPVKAVAARTSNSVTLAKPLDTDVAIDPVDPNKTIEMEMTDDMGKEAF